MCFRSSILLAMLLCAGSASAQQGKRAPEVLQTKPRFLSDRFLDETAELAASALPPSLSIARARTEGARRKVDLERLRERLLQQHEEGRQYTARPATVAMATQVVRGREASARLEEREPKREPSDGNAGLGILLALMGIGSSVYVTRRRS
ncbi:MAG: hypothetical protein H6834_18265 [Planctomycetes bacterium]|nr:hypothetical protein [Planctomycetota bacterium]